MTSISPCCEVFRRLHQSGCFVIETLTQLRRIADAVDVPVNADFEGGRRDVA
jgi:hypothetical protein